MVAARLVSGAGWHFCLPLRLPPKPPPGRTTSRLVTGGSGWLRGTYFSLPASAHWPALAVVCLTQRLSNTLRQSHGWVSFYEFSFYVYLWDSYGSCYGLQKRTKNIFKFFFILWCLFTLSDIKILILHWAQQPGQNCCGLPHTYLYSLLVFVWSYYLIDFDVPLR